MEGAYGPWVIDQPLYFDKRHRKQISTVKDYPKWVLKIVPHTDVDKTINTQELLLLNAMWNRPIRNAIEQPKNLYDAWGLTDEDFWYAMRRYKGHVRFADRDRWKEVARAALEFLCDLHRDHGLLHLDLKKENILVDDNGRCVVADYELVSRPKSGATCERSNYDRWYYMRYGAEWSEPICCWRMDLTMLGYVLAELTWDLENNKEWRFPRECTRHMEDDEDALYYTDVIALRSMEIARAHPVVCDYLSIVSELTWSPWTPPPSGAFYQRLLQLFL